MGYRKIDDASLTAVANAIREKGGTSETLTFPDGFSAAIMAISSGGAELNFDVAAYATDGERLAATPKENTIGVVTTTPITGYYLSATQPENMVNGLLWVSVGASSSAEFNILKKDNTIMLYPMSAKQYVNGVWVDVTAKTYQNGEWVDWITYLFRSGEGMSDDFSWASYANDSGYGTGTITDEKLYFKGTLFGFQKDDRVDLTNRSTVYFKINCSAVYDSRYDRFHLCASESPLTEDFLSNLSAPAMIQPSYNGDEEVALDVSALSGEYYIGGKTSYFDNTVNQTTIEVYEIRVV